MTDGGTAFQPGAEEVSVPFRPRSAYAGYRAFGDGDGAVLVEPKITHKLREAAENATAERRIAGGLLYGRGWADEQGAYLVVGGYLEAGPGENSGDRISSDGEDNFTLSQADLRLLREDAARMYSASLEVGWWRTLPDLGEFGPNDFVTQAELIGPDGVGLLVYGSGPHWGTAYLGPDGHAPDTAGTLTVVVEPEVVPVPDPVPESDEPQRIDLGAGESLLTDPGEIPAPPAEIDVDDLDPGDGLAEEPLPAGPAPVPARREPVLTPAPEPTGRRVISPISVPAQEWGVKPPNSGSEMPVDVMIVIGALVVVAIVAAIIIGVLLKSAAVGVIVGVVGLIAIFVFRWMAHL
jgi:hypothetical protein